MKSYPSRLHAFTLLIGVHLLSSASEIQVKLQLEQLKSFFPVPEFDYYREKENMPGYFSIKLSYK
ncbi:hypothetical protein FXW07_10235 [Methanosarcina sp. DH1]|uniref:hypothetical protein n=1 Tax=Methanosarcina sp. DH1 TaxID=2605695 RepID=UPI001E34E29B|nr:hypothetical protein [Methanosarcina sp. DH1]MCC4766983.1 hypothetical protein [Methanosarcina sp. DH1]